MKKDILSFSAQVGIRTDLFYRFRLILAFVFVFFITLFSAQEVQSEVTIKSDAVITVVGDAFIYSKDKAFNEQVSKNKDLKQNSNLQFIQNNELKITAKNVKKQAKVLTTNKKKPENIVLASKKVEKYKTINLPKKDINFLIRSLDDSSKFFVGSSSSNTSFVSPNNDFQLSKYFIKLSDWFDSVSIKFSHKINYFYNNDNSRLQVFHNDFSVRPPPSLI